MKFFEQCQTLEQVKVAYKSYAKQFHPDLGGSTEIMQLLNNEYSFVVAKIANGENLTTSEINDIISENEAYRKAVESIINLVGISVEIVGSWIWVSGNTYGCREILKANGFMWANAKKMWFFRTDEHKVSNRGYKMEMSEIRAKYGSHKVNNIHGRYAIA